MLQATLQLLSYEFESRLFFFLSYNYLHTLRIKLGLKLDLG